jgi:hypothetical protein
VHRLAKIHEIMHDYEIIEMTDHMWTKQKKENPEVIQFLKSINMVESLRVRDALQGGRTETICLSRRVNELLNEKIKYYDIISLYPFVMKYKSFPIGFPQYITENFDYTQYFYFGPMKVTVLPPRKLFFPVLPAKVGNKLVFTLCPLCAASKTKVCLHSDKERLMTGAWISEEVYKAVEKGNKHRKCFFFFQIFQFYI